MEKRLPLALFLSFLVLFAWQLTRAPLPETDGGGETAAQQAATDPGASGDAGAEGASEPAAAPLEGRRAASAEATFDVTIGSPRTAGGPEEPGHYFLRFSNRGARLSELRFLDYVVRAEMQPEERLERENWMPLLEPLRTQSGESGSLLVRAGESLSGFLPEDLSEVFWEFETLENEGARFTYAPGTGVVFEKTIRALPGTWDLSLELTVRNEGAEALPRRAGFTLVPAGIVPPALGDNFYAEPNAVAVGIDARGREHLAQQSPVRAGSEGARLNAGSGKLAFAGVHNKYFAFLLRDEPGKATLLDARWDPVVEAVDAFEGRPPVKSVETSIQVELDLPALGQEQSWKWLAYAGPKDPEAFKADLEAHGAILDEDLSTFSTIGRFLLAVLRLFHRAFGNWGVAIILLTICVRACLFPLNRRSQTAMARYQKKMKRIQPKIDELKKRFANDPGKQREAQAKLMQEEGAFPPLGGCLPVFVQIPIFFGLFSALRTAWDLRQADFALWIHDLSIPDRLLYMGFKVPLIVTELDLTYFNLLPLLMVVLWILQQRGMPMPSDPQAQQMQKIMQFMPVLFGVFLYNYAAGLSLYMITQSTLGIVEQHVIKKFWPIDDTEVVKGKKSGCAPFAGALENLAEKQRAEMERMQRAKRGGALAEGSRRKRR